MNANILRQSLLLTVVLVLATSCATAPVKPRQPAQVPKWSPFEGRFHAAMQYAKPFQETDLTVTFTAPDGERFTVPGFWNGARDWRVRFAPNLAGVWSYATRCSNTNDAGLHGITGDFLCTAPRNDSRFTSHGPIKVARDGRHLIHDDLTPFLWLGDTAWNAALLSTPEEWALYARTRRDQKFTAVQWVTTQWRASPLGDLNGQPAYTGTDAIELNLPFFARLDQHAELLARAGLLNVPVLMIRPMA